MRYAWEVDRRDNEVDVDEEGPDRDEDEDVDLAWGEDAGAVDVPVCDCGERG